MRPSRSGSPHGLARRPVAVAVVLAFAVGGLVSGPVRRFRRSLLRLSPRFRPPPSPGLAAAARSPSRRPNIARCSRARTGPPKRPLRARGSKTPVSGSPCRLSPRRSRRDSTSRVAGAGWLSAARRSKRPRPGLDRSRRAGRVLRRPRPDAPRARSGPAPRSGTLGTTTHVGTDSNGRQSFSLTMPLFAVQQGRVELPGVGLEVTVGRRRAARAQRAEGRRRSSTSRCGRARSSRSVFASRTSSEKGRSAALRASAIALQPLRRRRGKPRDGRDGADHRERPAGSRASPSRCRRDRRSCTCGERVCSRRRTTARECARPG